MRTESPISAIRPGAFLSDFTSPGLIIPRLRGDDAPSVIQELSQALQREKCLTDLLPFYHAALNREYLVSTDMEGGMAIPHARLPALKELAFAYGRSEKPLNWGTKATGAVRFVFLAAVPATDSTQYLILISAFTRLAQNSRLLEKLDAAPDAAQVMAVFKQVELRIAAGTNSARSVTT